MIFAGAKPLTWWTSVSTGGHSVGPRWHKPPNGNTGRDNWRPTERSFRSSVASSSTTAVISIFKFFFQNLVKWAHLHIRQLGRCSSLTWRCRWCRPDWPLKKLPSFTLCCHSLLASHLQSQVSPNSSNIEHEIFKFKCCDLLKTGMMIKLKVNDVSYLSGWTTYGSRRPSG